MLEFDHGLRLHRLMEKLKESPADTVWILQPENRRYLSGFRATDMQVTESSGSLLIREDRRVLVTDSRYGEEAKREAPLFEVQVPAEGMLGRLPGLLTEMGCRVVGFEPDWVTWSLWQRVREKIDGLSPPVRLEPLEGIVEGLREVKDAQELRAVEESARLMGRVLDEVVEDLRPGMTERAVARRIENLAWEAGAEGLAFPPIVASGPNGALPHAVPTQRPLKVGEAIVLDVGLKLHGYCCDMTRTVFLDGPDELFRKIYRTVREAQLAAMAEIRDGVLSTLPDAVARDIIREAGFGAYFGHALGHGVGLAAHERPRMAPRDAVTLKSGAVVTVEPGIYIPGKGGVRLEEMVVVEPDGARVLTHAGHVYDF